MKEYLIQELNTAEYTHIIAHMFDDQPIREMKANTLLRNQRGRNLDERFRLRFSHERICFRIRHLTVLGLWSISWNRRMSRSTAPGR